MAFSLKFQKFFSITRTIVFTLGQNNFGTKYHLYLLSLFLWQLIGLILSISDDLAYQTESEKKSYGGGGGQAGRRGSSQNRGHQSELDEKNQGMSWRTRLKSFSVPEDCLTNRPKIDLKIVYQCFHQTVSEIVPKIAVKIVQNSL